MATETYATTKRDRYLQTFSELVKVRSGFLDHWSTLANHVAPRRYRAFVTDNNKGDRRNSNIIDSTATFAWNTLKSGMLSGLSSPSRAWFKLSVPDPDLARFKPVQEWLHDVTLRMYAVMQKSNLYTALPIVYGDQGLFGTAAMALLDHDRDIFRCYPYPIGTYVLGISNEGDINQFGREYQMTVRQLVEEFAVKKGSRDIDWTNISTSTKNAYEKGGASLEQMVDVCWLICPNEAADPNKIGAKYLPFGSYYFEKNQEDPDKLLRESGFNEFPVVAPRWEAVAEDVYATSCPGMQSLGDIRGLQVMVKKKAQGVEKMINPPLQGPTALRNNKVTQLPGDMNYVDELAGGKGIRSLFDLRLPIDEMRADIQDVRYLIRRAWFEDLFLAITSMDAQGQTTERTAREIEERHEEKLLSLGPVVERNGDELFTPAIDRLFPMMDRRGMVPPAPPDLEGMELKVEYTSILAQAQKLVGVSNTRNFLADTLPLAEAFPVVKYKLNIPKAIDELGEAYSIHPDILVDTDEANQAMQAEQQQMAQAMAAQNAALTAKGTKDLSEADMSNDSALSRMVNGQ